MSDWEVKRLGQLTDRITVKNSAGHQRVLTVAAGHGLVDQETFFSKRVASADLSGYWVVEPGDFVYNKSASKDAPSGVIARWDGDGPGVVTTLYIVFRPRPGIESDYLLHACNGTGFFSSLRGKLREGARSHGLLNVRLAEFFGAELTVPPHAEQRRIIDVMATVDEHVRSLSMAEDKLADVLSGRLESTYREFRDTTSASRLGDVLVEVKRPVTVEPSASYSQIGIRSHGRGVFIKEPVTGVGLGSKKVYWVEPGDLVINIVFAWEGAVAVVPPGISGHCASHRFPTYQRTDGGDVDFFRYLFSTRDGVSLLGDCSPGGAGRNRTLNRRRLLDLPVYLPDPAVQRRVIAEFRALEAACGELRSELDGLRSFRSLLLAALLNREIEIPESYDSFLEKVS